MRSLTRGRAAAVGVGAASIVLTASVQATAEEPAAPMPTAGDTVATPTAGGTAGTASGRPDKRNVDGRRPRRNGEGRRQRGPAPTRVAPAATVNAPTPTLDEPTPTPTVKATAGGSSGRMVTVRVTSFGFNDNDDGNGHFGTAVIAHPSVHTQATESSGRFDDPITFASDAGEFAPGTMIYVPYLQKYFVMEDDCVACSEDWDKGIAHVDLWMGPSSLQPETPLMNCQNSITRSSATIEVRPGSGRTVDTTPMFTGGRCTLHLH